MFGPIKNVVFDFDGTLVNTMPSVVEGLGRAVEFGTGTLPEKEKLVATFGGTPLNVLRQWMDEATAQRALEFWNDFEKNLKPSDIKAFTGAVELLDGLKAIGIAFGIFTGRDRAGTVRIASAHGWMGKYFDEKLLICGDDGFKSKPSGDALLHLMKIHGWEPKYTLMVGDHPHDMRAGIEAGTKTAVALWDLPEGQGTQRSRFKEGWSRVDPKLGDLRLVAPLSLLEWLKNQDI